MSKIFSVDVLIAGTVYVKANNPRDARAKIEKQVKDATLLVQEAVNEGESDVPISGRRFDDPDLPELSLSPAMTVHGIWPDQNPEEIG